MVNLLREVVALSAFGPCLWHVACLWWAHRRGSDVPLGERLWNVVGGLAWGVGFCLMWLSPKEAVQIVGLALVLASTVWSVVWANRLRRRAQLGASVITQSQPTRGNDGRGMS